VISQELREFFSKNTCNHIEFWDCHSKQKWLLYYSVDKDTKIMVSTLSFPCKSSWDFCRKTECDLILSQWRVLFQAADSRGRNFLNLLDDDTNPIEPSSIKGSPWLQCFGHSNSCTWASRAIINHTLIGEYQLRFFPRKEFACLCGNYLIKTRQHILHECKRFNNYWNPRRNTIAYFTQVLFLLNSHVLLLVLLYRFDFLLFHLFNYFSI